MEWRSANTVGTSAEIKLSTMHNPNTIRKRVGLNNISAVYVGETPLVSTQSLNRWNIHSPPVKAAR